MADKNIEISPVARVDIGDIQRLFRKMVDFCGSPTTAVFLNGQVIKHD